MTGPPGRHTKKGGYVLDDTKVRVFVCPPPHVLDASPVGLQFISCRRCIDMSQLKPYVTRTIELSESQERKGLKGWKALKGRNYLRLITWDQKEEAIAVAKALPPLPNPNA